jgi:MerR family mercuric resistance operon transcriptional regulator
MDNIVTENKYLKIGEVAKAAGVNNETIRYYERLGLLCEDGRTESGYKQFSTKAVERLKFIKKAQKLGFTLNEIKKILSITDKKDNNRKQIREFTNKKIAEIEERIADLFVVKEVLSNLLIECLRENDDGDITHCPIIKEFSRN